MRKNAKVEIHYDRPVWVNPTTETIRRDECLCLNCVNFRPGAVSNCRIAQRLFEVCVSEGTALIVTRCPEYQPKTLAPESSDTKHVYHAPPIAPEKKQEEVPDMGSPPRADYKSWG